MVPMLKKIPLFSLVLLIVAAIDSIRNLPAAALFGSSLIFFFLFGAFIFFFPISLVVAEFSSRYSEEGGVFHWVRHAFGSRWGMMAVWLQWINTMVWYPTILSFIAGTAAYVIDPTLAENKRFLVSVILVVFWSLTFLNLQGIRVSAKINSWCSVIGTLLPMTLLILFGIVWMLSSHTLEISFTPSTMLPHLDNVNHWVSLVAIMASFVGMELAGVHTSDIQNPQRNFPRATAIAVGVLLFTMILGSLSIAVVIPERDLQLVSGIMQTFTAFFNAFGVPQFVPVLTVLIIVGSIGQMINWLISPAKGLLQAADHGFLPAWFTAKNQHGVAARILFAQAILVTLFCLAFLLMPSVNAFYWFLTALSTELYMFMYVLVFAAALKLGRPPREAGSYRIPKGSRTVACVIGLIGCGLTLVVGNFPPSGIDVGSAGRYALLVLAGNVVAILPVFGLWWFKRARNSL